MSKIFLTLSLFTFLFSTEIANATFVETDTIGTTIEEVFVPHPQIIFHDVDSVASNSEVEVEKTYTVKYPKTKAIKFIVIDSPVDIRELRITHSDGSERFLDAATGKLGKNSTRTFTFYERKGIRIKSFSVRLISPEKAAGNVKIQIGTVK